MYFNTGANQLCSLPSGPLAAVRGLNYVEDTHFTQVPGSQFGSTSILPTCDFYYLSRSKPTMQAQEEKMHLTEPLTLDMRR
jgi:hypothetical protein